MSTNARKANVKNWSSADDHVSYNVSMRTIASAEFVLPLWKIVRSTREPILITKRGKPVAKLVPAEPPTREFIGSLKGVFRIVGDIESPAVPTKDWESSR